MTLKFDFRHIFMAFDTQDPNSMIGTFLQRDTRVWYKVGPKFLLDAINTPNLIQAIGPQNIFLNLMLQGSPEIVAGVVRTAALQQIAWLSVHCTGDGATMNAAVETRKGLNSKMKLLGTTSLSSSFSVPYLAQVAYEAGLDGIVCSAKEVPLIRAVAGPKFLIVASEDSGERQITTMMEAAQNGADYVICKPDVVTEDFLDSVEEIFAVRA